MDAQKEDISISEMLACQRELWEKHRDSWSPMEPVYARNSLLWMIEEIGEVISVIKKRGEEDIMDDPEIRASFVVELCDVMMYFHDALLRYDVTPDEFARAFRGKHAKNMGRDFLYSREDFIQ